MLLMSWKRESLQTDGLLEVEDDGKIESEEEANGKVNFSSNSVVTLYPVTLSFPFSSFTCR